MNHHAPPGDLRSPRDARPAFLHRHTVTFEETNLVGNVYYARHVSWQGRCREMFLREHAPQILDELRRDLRLVTLRVACDYFEEFLAFDDVEIEMRLAHQEQHRIGLDFEYWLVREGGPRRLAASGFQETGCLRVGRNGANPVRPPDALLDALNRFRPVRPVAGMTGAAGAK